MMKLQFNRAATWIGFILINILAVSCGCGETPEEKERKKRAEEEKQLVAEEKQLMDKLKIHFKPEAWKKIEEDIKKEKNDLTEVDKTIEEFKYYLEIIEKLEKGNPIKLKSGEANQNFLFLFLSLKELTPEIDITELPSIMINPMRLKSIITNKDNLAKAKQASFDAIALYENLKKQLELKNKGKKLGDKKPSGEK